MSVCGVIFLFLWMSLPLFGNCYWFLFAASVYLVVTAWEESELLVGVKNDGKCLAIGIWWQPVFPFIGRGWFIAFLALHHPSSNIAFLVQFFTVFNPLRISLLPLFVAFLTFWICVLLSLDSWYDLFSCKNVRSRRFESECHFNPGQCTSSIWPSISDSESICSGEYCFVSPLAMCCSLLADYQRSFAGCMLFDEH